MTTNTIIHADQDLLGRRGADHPPIPRLDSLPDLLTSTNPAEISCLWCRRALGLLDDDPVPAEEESKVREWTVTVANSGGAVDEVTVDADEVEINDDPPTLSFLREGRLVAGFPLGRVVCWFSDDSQLEKDAPQA